LQTEAENHVIAKISAGRKVQEKTLRDKNRNTGERPNRPKKKDSDPKRTQGKSGSATIKSSAEKPGGKKNPIQKNSSLAGVRGRKKRILSPERKAVKPKGSEKLGRRPKKTSGQKPPQGTARPSRRFLTAN